MHLFDEFCEVDGEAGTAPFQWTFSPAELPRIRFGVRRSRRPAAGLVRYSAAPASEPPGNWRHVEAAPDQAVPAALADGYRLFTAELPALGDEGGYRYGFGYRTESGEVHWSDAERVAIITTAPRTATAIGRCFLGWVDGAAVYGPAPAVAITPAPRDWRRRLFYALIIDRFAVGAPERQGLGLVPYDPETPFASHGGDLAGIAGQLDYLAELGVGAVILSPVYVNARDGYHGYHPLHLLAVDPRLGSLEALRTLVAAAHRRGIAVILDVLVNHIADSIAWRQTGSGWDGVFHYWQGDKAALLPLPAELRDPGFFHPPGGDGPVGTPLFGFLTDWRTELPYVRDILIEHLKYWIAATDIDGFRFDAVRHVDLPFWVAAIAELDRYTRAIGKTGFLSLGEHAGEQAAAVGAYSKAAGFSGMIDYPLYYRFRAIFGRGERDLRHLKPHFDHDIFASRDSRLNLAFLDNQDTSRFLHRWRERFGGLEPARAALRAALALLILGPEMPCLYYGTEQEFSGAHGTHAAGPGAAPGAERGHDCYVREDMFPNPDCTWLYGPVNRPLHPPYDRSNPTFAAIRTLAALRAAVPALHAGDRHAVIDDDPELLAWLMAELGADLGAADGPASGDLVLVAINFAAARPAERTLCLAEAAWSLPEAAGRALAAAAPGETLYAAGEAAAEPGPAAGTLRLRLGPLAVLVLRLAAAGPPRRCPDSRSGV